MMKESCATLKRPFPTNAYWLVFLMLPFFLVSCAAAQSNSGDTKLTMQDLKRKRLMFVFDCMGIDPKNPDAADTGSMGPDKSEECQREVDNRYPMPPAITVKKLLNHCMKEAGIPNETEYKTTPSQMEDFDACLREVPKYRPVVKE